MTSTRTTGSRAKRGPVARSELNGKGRHVDFRGLELSLPAVAPGEIMFDVSENDIMLPLKTLLGDEQMGRLRAKVVEEKLSLPAARAELLALLNRIFSDVYAVSPGE